MKRSRQGECVVCEVESDSASLHFGQSTCRACAAFFRRTVSQNLQYNCQRNGDCEIEKGGRNACRACRFKKCLAQGMQISAVQNGREIALPGLPPLATLPSSAVSSGDYMTTFYNNGQSANYISNEHQQQQQQHYQQESPTSSTSITTSASSSISAGSQSQSPALPPQYKHLGQMREGLHQYGSLMKATQAMMAQEDLLSMPLMAGIAEGEQRHRSHFESTKKILKVAYGLMFDLMERFCSPFNELPLDDKRKIFNNYKPLYCNTCRAYLTSKEYGPGDDRLVMPDGGHVQLGQLHLFFKDSKLVTGQPEQVARVFQNAIGYLLTNVVGHMRSIDIQETECVAMIALFLWADSPELSPKTQQLVQQVRNEIIIDLHHFYHSQGHSAEEITLKTANLFLLIPKVEAVVKMILEDASISDLFNLVVVEESYKGHMLV